MIWFDVDGVLRELVLPVMGYYGSKCHNYFCSQKGGRDFIRIVDDEPLLLIEASPTKYYRVVRELPEINILSCQPENWRNFTTKWLKKYFPSNKLAIEYVYNTPDKLSYIGEGDFLVEDYPFFQTYERIALVTYPYNKHIEKPYTRIRKVGDLEKFLKEEYGKKA